jgi:glycosyltransferase involved in cell wall biosynthesis
MAPSWTQPSLLCFSHLRWDFVYQRPQHLMSRAARGHRVLFIEEPIIQAAAEPHIHLKTDPSGVTVVTPVLPEPGGETALIERFISQTAAGPRTFWYYTPMMRRATAHLAADVIVYDCMDELSAFHAAPPELKAREAELLEAADVVFTGGQRLYEAKRGKHPNVHAFPSSVDAAHFARARRPDQADPAEQAPLGHPRLGFFGVIDERFDAALLGRLAELKPGWSFLMVGPIVKIDSAGLPRRPNIHWLGGRSYQDLPAYLAHWDLGLMPFALNEATHFISPTKTPEFLAAGLPVVSSAIADVVRPYGERGLVEIATNADDFAAAAEKLLARPRTAWLAEVDAFLGNLSWDRTWEAMLAEMRKVQHRRKPATSRTAVPMEASYAGL